MSGFYLQTSDGNPIHVNGNPKMSQENKDALLSVLRQHINKKPTSRLASYFLKSGQKAKILIEIKHSNGLRLAISLWQKSGIR